MNRKNFIKSLAVIPFANTIVQLNALSTLEQQFKNTEKMPVLFLGHGSPMNAIEENDFVKGFRGVSKTIPKPAAILCISAHWETRGTYVTAMEHPRTIHDFGGFPPALYEVQYPAPGSPALALETKNLINNHSVMLDESWGLDHGAWSVIKHMYPLADIPVIQMSLDQGMTTAEHYELAKQLRVLRHKGVLIVGSGNMVHNLRMLAWDKMDQPGFAFDWAAEASSKMKSWILSSEHKKLIDYRSLGKAFDYSIPTPEHYLPLIYALALKEEADTVELFNDRAVGGSITMTSIKIS